jgi:cyclopropane fatty-acyl-phospholipid synthase-like methyltransferase
MVAWLSERIKKEGLQNARAEQVKPDATSLEEASVDRILVVNVWHHIDEREAYLEHVVSRLKPNGALCVVEIKRDAPKGPPVAHRLSAKDLTAELSKNPRLEVSASPLELPHQHLVVARLK